MPWQHKHDKIQCELNINLQMNNESVKMLKMPNFNEKFNVNVQNLCQYRLSPDYVTEN